MSDIIDPAAMTERKSAAIAALSTRIVEKAAATSLETALVENAFELATIAAEEDGMLALKSNVEKWIEADSSLEMQPSEVSVLATSALALGSQQRLRIPDKPVPGVFEGSGEPVKVYENEVFENWGGTIDQVFPRYTFVPTTRSGVVSVVRFALKNGFRVRAAGTRHTWTDMYGASGEVLISMVELGAAEPLPGRLPSKNPVSNELEHIELVRVEDGGDTALVRVGAAATSEHFRLWCLFGNGDWQWMLNALPVLVEITTAGSGQLICHGAGINHQTVSDVVVEMEFVNCRGEIQRITEKEELRAATGCFGLLGILLSQTFRVNKLELANLCPRKVPVALTVPPPSREDVPETNDIEIEKFSDAQLEEARKAFVEDANKFYSEWFWFPFQDDCWINCWDTSEFQAGGDRPSFPNDKEVRWQKAQSAIGELFQKTALRLLGGITQAKLFGKTGMAVLPDNEKMVASVCDALHFRRGVHKLEVRDFELELEIPLGRDGKPDFSIVQKAWWMAIQEVYRERAEGRAPMRIALEMRIMGGSEIIMASQRGNAATCAIEVLTNPLVDENEWQNFIQNVMDKWGSLKDPVTNKPLNARPHWAKEWPEKVRGQNVRDYLKEEFKDHSEEFKTQLSVSARKGGYSLQDAFNAFGNDNILGIIGEASDQAHRPDGTKTGGGAGTGGTGGTGGGGSEEQNKKGCFRSVCTIL